MAIPNKQIGWSQESNLLWEVLKNIQRLNGVLSNSSSSSVTTEESSSVAFSGDGSLLTPLSADVKKSSFGNQGLIELSDGLYSPSQIRNGVVSGGLVTYLGTGFDYNVSPAVYYINGVLYTSPSTNITLDPPSVVTNEYRFDSFVLTTSGTADKVTGISSLAPVPPVINSSTQLEVSFVIVFANTTQNFPPQEYIYREGVEWIPSFNSANIVQSVLNPIAGTYCIEGTNVVSGNNVTLTKGSVTGISNRNVVILNVRSKATWGSNRTLTLRFRNGVSNVGNLVTIPRVGKYGFDSSVTGVYQRIVIPVTDFGLTVNDTINNLVITADGSGGTQGFFIDDVELQGTYIANSTVGTTDNLGVFYVSKNYSGIGAARYDNGVFSATPSTNAGFINQLNSARMGDANKAYPDPWAAAKAATAALFSGQISRALVIVNGNNTWTYGSDTASNNGDLLGNSGTPTVADVGLLTGNSLMRDKIDFFFHPGSTLINICRNQQILLGLNTSTSNTVWKSGIYGHGTFIAIYGTNNGLSQRMFQIGNGNGEMTVEADTIICQRAPFFVNGGESPLLLKIKAKKFVTDGTGSLLFYSPGAAIGVEPTLPSSIVIDIDTVFKGQKYFPYPSTPQVSSGDNARYLFDGGATNINTSTRPKDITFNMRQCFIHDSAGWLVQDNSGAYLSNLNVDMNIGFLKQEMNLTKTGNYLRGGISLGRNVNSGEKINTTFNFNINTAEVEECLLTAANFTSRLAASTNNIVRLKVGEIVKTGAYAGATGQYIFGIPTTSPGSAGEPVRTIIECDYALSNLGNVFKAELLFAQNNTLYRNNMIIKGTFKTTAASPVIDSTLLTSGNTGIVLDNASLITAGTQSINSTTVGDIYYSKQAYSNVAVNGANITTQGTFNVDANIANFI